MTRIEEVLNTGRQYPESLLTIEQERRFVDRALKLYLEREMLRGKRRWDVIWWVGVVIAITAFVLFGLAR